MTTTEIELRTVDGMSFLEANKAVVEQCAVQAIMELMNSCTDPTIKLAAASAALKSIGKAEPPQAAPQTTNNFQINTAIAGEIGKALAGLAGVSRLMVAGPNPDNAPQTPAESNNG